MIGREQQFIGNYSIVVDTLSLNLYFIYLLNRDGTKLWGLLSLTSEEAQEIRAEAAHSVFKTLMELGKN